ncbi:MAG TPA: DMT family transporter [Allosphingosinicella sp.]|nr:DMT family transporter [Allosphingosinicella sp.]
MASPRPQQNRLLGIGIRLLGATSFAIMAAMIKLGYDQGANTVELAFYRHAFGLLPLLVWMLWSRSFGAWRTQRPGSHLTRAVVGLTTMLLAFTALDYLPLAEATTISFAAPLFAVALSALLLGEAVGRHRWSAVLAGFIGVLIVMRPGNGDLPAIGLGIALAAAFGVACVNILIRQLGRTEAPQTSVLWFTLSSMLILGIALPFFGQGHDFLGWAILLAVGIFGGIGQLCLNASLRYAPVPVIVPFDYTQLLWAVLLGWLIWDTQAPATTWMGAAVIVGSGLYTVYREHRLGRDKPKVAPPL